MSVVEEGDVAQFLYVEREEVVGEVPDNPEDAIELVAEDEEQENHDYLNLNHDDNREEGTRTRRRRRQKEDKENNPVVSSRPSPLCPFQTAKEFGNWLFESMGSQLYTQVHLQFIKYCARLRIQSLVRFGKRKFSGMNRLFFFQGVRLVAVSMSQKIYVDKVLQVERGKLMQKLGASRLANL